MPAKLRMRVAIMMNMVVAIIAARTHAFVPTQDENSSGGYFIFQRS